MNNKDDMQLKLNEEFLKKCKGGDLLVKDLDKYLNIDPLLLKHASDGIKNNRDFVFAMVRRCIHALKFASDNLRSDRKFILKAIHMKVDEFLCFVSEILKSDKEFVLDAVKRHGSNLQYASKECKDDLEIVVEAFLSYAPSLFWASKRLHKFHKLIGSSGINDVDCMNFWFFENEVYSSNTIVPRAHVFFCTSVCKK